MINSLLNIFGNFYNKITWGWIIIGIALLFINGMIIILAVTGLGTAQITHPEYFHGHYLNYNNLWLMINLWTVGSILFIIIAIISLSTHKIRGSEN